MEHRWRPLAKLPVDANTLTAPFKKHLLSGGQLRRLRQATTSSWPSPTFPELSLTDSTPRGRTARRYQAEPQDRGTAHVGGRDEGFLFEHIYQLGGGFGELGS